MKVYHAGTKVRRQKSFMMSVAPAADLGRNQEAQSDWVDRENNPVQFNIEFTYGEAEVDDSIGKYLIDKGYCLRTRLILPRLEEASPELSPEEVEARAAEELARAGMGG